MTIATPAAAKLTPMMAQWQSCKNSAGDALLLFRMGDFYEAFYEDAETIASAVGLTLTQRQGIPMAGIPRHTVDSYIDKLIAQRFRVAIAEQMEDPKTTKGLVKREVVRVVTPGTLMDSNLLQDKLNNFFACVSESSKVLGLASVDMSTGEFSVSEHASERELLEALCRLKPAEVLSSPRFKSKFPGILDELQLSYRCLLSNTQDWHFDLHTAHEVLTQHLGVKNLEGFGLGQMSAARASGGALLRYIRDELSLPIEHIRSVHHAGKSPFLEIDRASERNLELSESLQDRSRRSTLLGILDETQTPMGSRRLIQWLRQPLLNVDEIHARQDAVEALLVQRDLAEALRDALARVRDLERLMMKVSSRYASPRDLAALRFSLEPIPDISAVLAQVDTEELSTLHGSLGNFTELTECIAEALLDEPALRLGEGKVFRSGYDEELDELQALSRSSKEWLAAYQERLREETGLRSIKVGYNRVFGYYIEVSKGQAHSMPDTFSRRQTLTNSERFLSPELKVFEEKVLSAEERIHAIENRLYNALRDRVAGQADAVTKTASIISHIDCLLSLSLVAHRRGYQRPVVDDGQLLHIEEGRHPVIEAVNLTETFVPNDTHLGDSDKRLALITGPNMAGKSTYIRQVALLTIMAQMGSFIPAKRAQIGVVDKVFTRIGASDDLSRGQSTFMVEMTETANILNNATDRSLVILDEIGRGTSTYDGISIAWAVAEYLLTHEGSQAKTLFATHYWELTELEKRLQGAKNYHIAVRECAEEIIFLRKILEGSADKSYGIHVAKVAGVPAEVLKRARAILGHLEDVKGNAKDFEPPQPPKRTVLGAQVKGSDTEIQLLLFEPPQKNKAKYQGKGKKTAVDSLRESLTSLDLNKLTPLDAHALLVKWKTEISR